MNFGYPQLNAYVRRYLDVTEQELQLFHSFFKPLTLKKKQFLLRAGDVCALEAYVVKGCVRVYFVDEKGVEVDVFFAVEDWWVSDIASFTQQKPADLFIQALEECELLVIDYATKEKMYTELPKFERMFRIMMQRSYDNIIKRLISTIAQPADQRYLAFIERYPDMPQRIPQHLIAAYLGISPEFLSKIRSKLAKR